MGPAFDEQQLLAFGRGLEQPFAEVRRHVAVVGAVHDQHRHANLGDLVERVELLRQHQLQRQPRVAQRLGNVGQRGERGFDNQAARLLSLAQAGGEVDGDGAAQRVAVDEAPLRVGLALGQILPGHPRVFIHGLFGRQVAVALAETAVVDGQHGKAEVMQLLDAKQLAGQVPARAMQVEHRRRRWIGSRPPPGIDVLGLFAGLDWQAGFDHAIGHAAVPAGRAGHDAKQQLALFLHELAAAGNGQRQRQAGDQKKAHALAQPLHQETENSMLQKHAGIRCVQACAGRARQMVRLQRRKIVPRNIGVHPVRMSVRFSCPYRPRPCALS